MSCFFNSLYVFVDLFTCFPEPYIFITLLINIFTACKLSDNVLSVDDFLLLLNF